MIPIQKNIIWKIKRAMAIPIGCTPQFIVNKEGETVTKKESQMMHLSNNHKKSQSMIYVT